MAWQRPPVPTIHLPATLILSPPDQEETVEFFRLLGWTFTESLDGTGHLNFFVDWPQFYRTLSGSTPIARLFEDFDQGGEWEYQQMVLPLYDSRGDLVFAIEMAECWPRGIEQFFYPPKDKVIEKTTFFIDDIGYSQ